MAGSIDASLSEERSVHCGRARNRGAQHHAALFLLAIGGAIYFRCVWDFARIGRGTPAPIDAPKVWVVRGLYQYVRNPIYIGVLLIVLGLTVYFASFGVLVYGVCLALGFHLFVIFVEEPSLRRRFGESYERIEVIAAQPRHVRRSDHAIESAVSAPQAPSRRSGRTRDGTVGESHERRARR